MSFQPHFLVDPERSAARSGDADLFAAENEFARPARDLGAMVRAGTLPREVVLHLYTYEVAERVRDLVPSAPSRLVLPFWPASLVTAAHVPVHAVEDILALVPSPWTVTCRAPAADVVAQVCRDRFGAQWFDPDRYVEDLHARAAREGWLTE